MATDLDLILGKSQYALFCGITFFSFFVLKYSFFDNSGTKYPYINPKKPFEFSNQRVVQDFIENAKEILVKGRSLYKDTPYKAHTDLGDVLVIPPEFIDALKSERKLDFTEVAKDVSIDLRVIAHACVTDYYRILMVISLVLNPSGPHSI
jgi:hypothetical protein